MNREAYGQPRLVCGCELCQVGCRTMPAQLMPGDLERLAPGLTGPDLLAWAEAHLLASEGPRILIMGQVLHAPTLVPASAPDGCCHWFAEGRCTVHAVSPFGCAMFDAHNSNGDAAAEQLSHVSTLDLLEHWAAALAGMASSYTWEHLHCKGLRAGAGDKRRAAYRREMDRVQLRLLRAER